MLTSAKLVSSRCELSGQSRGDTFTHSLFVYSCVDSLLINGRGQRMCPPLSFLESIAPPNLLPLTSKGCIFPNNSILLGPSPNLTSQYPDRVNSRTFFGCDNTTNVSVLCVEMFRRAYPCPFSASVCNRSQRSEWLRLHQRSPHRRAIRAKDRYRRP